MATAATKKGAASFAFVPTDSQISKANAETIGKRFVELAGDGEVTPPQIVEDARDPSSLLHPFFEWNDRKAAEKQRLQHARWLIGAISIEITYENGSREKTRAFHSVTNDGDRGYATSPRVFSDSDLTRQVVGMALRELDSWQKRFERYEALGESRELVKQASRWLREKIKG